MKDFDRAIERLFRFVEMCGVTGLLNIALRTALPSSWALVLTLPFAVLAMLYLIWPIVRSHGKTMERLDPQGTFLTIFGMAALVGTLWLADRLSQSADPDPKATTTVIDRGG